MISEVSVKSRCGAKKTGEILKEKQLSRVIIMSYLMHTDKQGERYIHTRIILMISHSLAGAKSRTKMREYTSGLNGTQILARRALQPRRQQQHHVKSRMCDDV